ncbi:MAG TPA: UMP kinase [Bacteroidales bacterium]|nr:UMP kinase [Bacteroidales bacterium]
MSKYKRILLKLSGESLSGGSGQTIDPGMLAVYAEEISSLTKAGIQVGVVLGGGNIFRGVHGITKGIARVQGDYMGMLATIINSMALQAALANMETKATVLSGLPVEPICEKMSSKEAIALLNQGHVVIMAGGTGNPFFTTDSAAALRAVEIEAEVFLKGTRVDGVYTADPEKDPSAKLFSEITFEQALAKNLRILDQTAFALCQDNDLPIIVFNIHKKGILKQILIEGLLMGTLVSN